MQSISIHLSVKGMTCGACSSTIEEQANNLFKNEMVNKYKDLDLHKF